MEKDYQIDEQENKQYVDIFPLTKWKRILVFLADFFLTFIISLLLFNILVLPLGRTFTRYNERLDQENQAVEKMHSVLYNNKLLYKDPAYSYNNINVNITYTFDVWLSYYALDEAASIDDKNPQYGHKEENKVFYHFYHDLRNDDATYKKFFDLYNEKDKYFTVDTNQNYVLNERVKNEVKYYFDPRSEMGSNGKTFYNNLKNNVFAPMLSEVLTDIGERDLVFEGVSYIENQKNHLAYNKYLEDLSTATAFISLGIGWLIYYVIIPFIHKNRKTLAMMMMSVERVNIDRLYICKRKEMILPSIYYLLTNLVGAFFVPLTFVSFNYLFSLTFLLTFALGSLVFNIASLFFILFNSYNRSLSDIFSRSVMITTKNLDEIYKARGYNI